MYDQRAKATYSENDVKAFVYQWFAGFDHQKDIDFFKKHLNPGKVDMDFPDFPVKSIADFEKWYQNVINNVQWNAHIVSNLQVRGDETGGFAISLDLNWKVRSYENQIYDVRIHQDWFVIVDQSKNFIITRQRARVIRDY